MDWDDAYANMAHVPGAAALPEIWANNATDYRASGVRIETVRYGELPREELDLIYPDGPFKGLFVFIHGGYWMKFDKNLWTDLAEGARQLGWVVAMPSYTLAPEARIAEITGQMTAAITTAARQISGPIRLTGHSAGGHLASRMICADTTLSPEILARIEKTVSISGVHDLRPLMWTKLNDELRIDEAEAIAESPMLLRPTGAPDYSAWVGGGERPVFIGQSQAMAQVWQGLGVNAECVVDGDHNHFTVIEALKDPASPLVTAICG